MAEEQKALFDLAAQDALDHVAREKPDEAQRECMRLCEALIFAATEPLSEEEMARRLPEGADLAAALAFLKADYFSRGVNLVAGRQEMVFPHRARSRLGAATRAGRAADKLSRAAMETLAIVAYHQPVDPRRRSRIFAAWRCPRARWTCCWRPAGCACAAAAARRAGR